MTTIYLLALLGVTVLLLTAGLDTVTRVASPARWESPRMLKPHPTLSAVVTVERRKSALPFAGRERRRDRIAAAKPAADNDARVQVSA